MHSSEEEISQWKLFRQGDWNAYTYFFNRYFSVLYNYGHKFTRNSILVEDGIQDLFVGLWTNRQTLTDPESIKNYLYKALRHNLFRKIQSQARFLALPEDKSMFADIPFDQQWVLLEEEETTKQRVSVCIATLPPRQREIIFLRFYESFDYAEIANVMDITVASAYKLLYKALHGMQLCLRA